MTKYLHWNKKYYFIVYLDYFVSFIIEFLLFLSQYIRGLVQSLNIYGLLKWTNRAQKYYKEDIRFNHVFAAHDVILLLFHILFLLFTFSTEQTWDVFVYAIFKHTLYASYDQLVGE